MKEPTPVIVIGAGIVGICCALELQRRGRNAILVDRGTPMSETSFGNAGIICNSGIYPLASPSLRKQAPFLLSNRDPRLLVRYAEIPRMAGWLWRFAANCSVDKHQTASNVLTTLTRDALPRHLALMRESACEALLQPSGWLSLYRSDRTFSTGRKDIAALGAAGVEAVALNPDQLREIEPDLGTIYRGGVWLKNTHSVSDPEALGLAYLELFRQLGGDVMQRSVRGMRRNAASWRLHTDSGHLDADIVVIAAGAWSNSLLDSLDVRLPFIMERGYHMMFSYPPNRRLGRSIVDQDLGYVITPMNQGLRATTASNPVSRECPPDPRQLIQLLPEISRTFPVGAPLLDQPWMGRRVSTPDSLPLIGPLRDHPGVIIATGHSHLGLTFAPVTGQLVADEVFGKPNPLCAPLAPLRRT